MTPTMCSMPDWAGRGTAPPGETAGVAALARWGSAPTPTTITEPAAVRRHPPGLPGLGRHARGVVAVMTGVRGDEGVVGRGRLAGQVGGEGRVGHHVAVAAGGVLDDRRVVHERVVPGGVAGLVRVAEGGR